MVQDRQDCPFRPQNRVFQGAHVLLEPLDFCHAEDLFLAAQDGDFWRFMPEPRFPSVAETKAWIKKTRSFMEKGDSMAYAVIHGRLGKAIGSTRLFDFRAAERALEIGWTWIAKSYWRSPVNTECKWLLLRHAFEELSAQRVQLKTDARNMRSQKAIERLGAVREGVLRKHWRLWDGYLRDSVYYSVLASEWPRVRENLLSMLNRRTLIDSSRTENTSRMETES